MQEQAAVGEAGKLCAGCKTVQPLNAFNVDRAKKDGKTAKCKSCHAEYRVANKARTLAYSKEYRVKNREIIAAKHKEYVRRNLEYLKAKGKEYRDSRREHLNRRQRAYYAAHSEAMRAYQKSLRKMRPELIAYYTARRKAAMLQATPDWANPFLMQEIYALATLRTKATGMPWEVDHIVPLQSKTVCGLHCEANMAVITEKDNASKGNRWWPGMPSGDDVGRRYGYGLGRK